MTSRRRFISTIAIAAATLVVPNIQTRKEVIFQTIKDVLSRYELKFDDNEQMEEIGLQISDELVLKLKDRCYSWKSSVLFDKFDQNIKVSVSVQDQPNGTITVYTGTISRC